jgi:hypothetical protein
MPENNSLHPVIFPYWCKPCNRRFLAAPNMDPICPWCGGKEPGNCDFYSQPEIRKWQDYFKAFRTKAGKWKKEALVVHEGTSYFRVPVSVIALVVMNDLPVPKEYAHLFNEKFFEDYPSARPKEGDNAPYSAIDTPGGPRTKEEKRTHA